MSRPNSNETKLQLLRRESAYTRLRSTVNVLTGVLVVTALVQWGMAPYENSFFRMILSVCENLILRALIIPLIDIADNFLRRLKPGE